MKFLPPYSEAGDIDHLAATFLFTHGGVQGNNLRKSPTLQYSLYLSQIALIIFLLSNNLLFLNDHWNPRWVADSRYFDEVAHCGSSQHLVTHRSFLGFSVISIGKKHEVRVNCTCLLNDGHRLAFQVLSPCQRIVNMHNLFRHFL